VTSARAKTIELTTFAFGRSAASPIAHERRRDVISWWRAVIDQALGGDRGTDPLLDDADDFESPLSSGCGCRYPITDADRRGGLGVGAVDPDVPS